MILTHAGLRASKLDPSQDNNVTDPLQLVEGNADLGGAARGTWICGLNQHEALQETTDEGISNVESLSTSRGGKEDKLLGATGEIGQVDIAESLFSLSDQSKESDEEISLIDIDSECSFVVSIWGSNKLTCRRKPIDQFSNGGNHGTMCTGEQPNDQEGAGELQWDYTPTQETFSKIGIADESPVGSMIGPSEQVGPPSLELIYRTMVHNHEQAQKESRKTKIANKQLQSSTKRVVKSCHDISTRITTMVTHTDALETEVKATAKQMVSQEQQILDMQWKLEDAENRQRLNNMWILGIAEGLEGQDTRAHIVCRPGDEKPTFRAPLHECGQVNCDGRSRQRWRRADEAAVQAVKIKNTAAARDLRVPRPGDRGKERWSAALGQCEVAFCGNGLRSDTAEVKSRPTAADPNPPLPEERHGETEITTVPAQTLIKTTHGCPGHERVLRHTAK
ncbi:hypothetical protein NDU88_000355 [Pleurodeles waltl]|uniref:Uncharacterized protein n=1 Tax=Pleurodeles waltl TaxID=8319 RepID=A0AAV7UQ96_PLEWA|nr:hypothetical protein NDU88_000355 [Pleurodeles waltl]